MYDRQKTLVYDPNKVEAVEVELGDISGAVNIQIAGHIYRRVFYGSDYPQADKRSAVAMAHADAEKLAGRVLNNVMQINVSMTKL